MFKKIYNLFGKVIVFLLLSTLIVGLTFWGLSDILISRGSDVVAKVGNSKIYNNEVESELMAIKSQLARQPLPQEQKDQLLEMYRENTIKQLVNQTLLLNEMSDMNIELDGKQIIKKDFVESPTYSPDYLKSVIRQYGGEKLFLKRLTKDKKILIAENFFSSINMLPEKIIEKLHQHEKQKRKVSLIKFDESLVKTTPNPSDSELISYYNQNKQDFLAPEYRSFSYLAITPESLGTEGKEQEDVSEQLYELSNLLLDKIAEGLELEEISKELNIPLKEVASINEKSVALDGDIISGLPKAKGFLNKVFKHSQEEVSDIIESADGLEYVVFKVDGIVEQRERALDEVKALVLSKWKKEKKIALLLEKATEIKNKLEAGKSIDSVLKQNSVKPKKVIEVTRADKKLPKNIVFEIFNKKVNEFTNIYPNGKAELIIARVEKIIEAGEIDPIEYIDTQNNVEDELSGELISEYISHLSGKYKIER